MFDATYTTVNGPLNKDSTPAVDWAEINYDATYKTDKGKWYCNDKWTDYSKANVKPYDATTPKW